MPNSPLDMPCASSMTNTVFTNPGTPGNHADENWYRPDIARQILKQLMKRSDASGLKNFGLWIALLLASGAVALYSWGTWWAVPAFFAGCTALPQSGPPPRPAAPPQPCPTPRRSR